MGAVTPVQCAFTLISMDGENMKFSEKGNIITLQKMEDCFVYFLLKGEEVVYVGKTTIGMSRPFQHKDKDFDEIKLIYCDEESVDKTEDDFIAKYRPIYNKKRNYAERYSLKRVRDIIRRETGIRNYTVPRLRKLLKKLGITPERDIYTNGFYISKNQEEETMAFIRRYI